jgi:SAM-dependent methyltransferase
MLYPLSYGGARGRSLARSAAVSALRSRRRCACRRGLRRWHMEARTLRDVMGPRTWERREIASGLDEVVRRWGDMGATAQEVALDAPRHIEHAEWIAGAESVLDIGGGYGFFSPLCAVLGARSVLLDSFHPYSEGRRTRRTEAMQKLESYGLEIVERDALDTPLPFPDDSFDAITCFDAMEHFHRSPRALFAEIRRVGREGATFVLGVPNAVNLRKRLAVLVGKTNWALFEDWYEPDEFHGHVREPVVEDLARIARDMELRDWRIVGRNWLGYRGGPLKLALTRAFDKPLRRRPSLCANIYVIGRLTPPPATDSDDR